MSNFWFIWPLIKEKLVLCEFVRLLVLNYRITSIRLLLIMIIYPNYEPAKILYKPCSSLVKYTILNVTKILAVTVLWQIILPKPLTWSGTERIGLFHFLADNSCDDAKAMHIGDFGAISVTGRRLRLADLESGSLPVFVVKWTGISTEAEVNE